MIKKKWLVFGICSILCSIWMICLSTSLYQRALKPLRSKHLPDFSVHFHVLTTTFDRRTGDRGQHLEIGVILVEIQIFVIPSASYPIGWAAGRFQDVPGVGIFRGSHPQGPDRSRMFKALPLFSGRRQNPADLPDICWGGQESQSRPFSNRLKRDVGWISSQYQLNSDDFGYTNSGLNRFIQFHPIYFSQNSSFLNLHQAWMMTFQAFLQVGECLVPLVMTQCADAQIVSILEVISRSRWDDFGGFVRRNDGWL